jgi:hypothetical protein
MRRAIMRLTEAHPTRPGFHNRYYATVDIGDLGSGWQWLQVDNNGNSFGELSSPFNTEDDAANDALDKLGGDDWEEF